MKSIWAQTCELPERTPLPGDMTAEVAVIGAGLAGILTAYELTRAGKQVVVLEAGRTANGQTQNTTAKITSQHGMIYHRIMYNLGEEAAKLYARANEEAIEEYRRLINREKIDCDFEERCAYLYGNDTETLQAEAYAARRSGIAADFVREVSLPFFATGAVRFERQAQFHPLKLIRSIAEKLTIYEGTTAREVRGNTIITDRGRVQAGKIVFACHFPFINFPGMYFAKLHQERSYVLALKNARLPDGIFLGADQPSYSFRSFGDLLLLGGGGHRAGENTVGGRYELLRQKAREWYPDAVEVAHWSAQDCMPADRIPYIGQFSSGRPDWFVATGFQKWGMTTSMVAAVLLRDLLCGRTNEYTDLFAASRFSLQSIPQMTADGLKAVKGIGKRFFQLPKETTEKLEKGHGGIVQLHGKKIGIYKDEAGTVYPVDIRCPHLGCQLEWNPDEKSWDCPCHGSRFDYRGRLLSGPAQEDVCNG